MSHTVTYHTSAWNFLVQPLIKLILDLDNEEFYELTDYYKLTNLDNSVKLNSSTKFDQKHISKINLMSELLDCIWPYLLNNLSFSLRKDPKSIDKQTNDQDRCNLQLIFNTLKSSEQLIEIVYELNQTARCVEIFDLFLSTILTDLDENVFEKSINFNIFQIAAIRIIFRYAIQLSSDSPEIWKFVLVALATSVISSTSTLPINSIKVRIKIYANTVRCSRVTVNLKQKLNRSPKKDKKDVNLGDLLHMESGLDLNNLNELESLDTLYDLDKLTNSSNSSINLIDECDLLNEFSIDKIDEYCNNLNKI